jgi:hypothetical protein
MAGSTYSSNLKIELMTTGENSGTWGDVTNTNLGTALEQAVIGLGNPDYTSDANLTISITNSNASQAARCLVLNVTSVFGSLTQTRELVVPTIQKQYIVQNNTTGGQSITVKTSAGTGITVPNGRKAHLYVNGTDVIQMFDFVNINGGTIDNTTIGATTASSGKFTTLNASGATTLDGTVALGNAAGDIITVPGTINSNLIFTDNTYDIGASGATRPRNLFLAGAATIGGNLSVGGTLTLTGGVNLNGNVTVGDSAADTLTINATITSNLIFTDNTYDIGASGATRPRNLFLAGNATIGGAQTLTGALTVDSTTDSSSTTTGSIQTDGGLGVAKTGYFGTNLVAGTNVGIGMTPEAGLFSSMNFVRMSASTGTSIMSNSTSARFGVNWAFNSSGTDAYGGNGPATLYYQESTNHRWYASPTNSSGALAVNPYENNMLLSRYGNLLLGNGGATSSLTATPWGTGYSTVEMKVGGTGIAGTASATHLFNNAYDSSSGAWVYAFPSKFASLMYQNGNSTVWQGTVSTQGAGNAIVWQNLMQLTMPATNQATLTIGNNAGSGVGRNVILMAQGGYNDQPGNQTTSSNGDKFVLYEGINRSAMGIGTDYNFWSQSKSFEWWISPTNSSSTLTQQLSLYYNSLNFGANDNTARYISVKYSTVPMYMSNSFDGTNGISTISNNIWNQSNGSYTWSSFANSTYGAACIQLWAPPAGNSYITMGAASAANTAPTGSFRVDKYGISSGSVNYTSTISGTIFPNLLSNQNLFTDATTNRVLAYDSLSTSGSNWYGISGVAQYADDWTTTDWLRYVNVSGTWYNTHSLLKESGLEREQYNPGFIYEVAEGSTFSSSGWHLVYYSVSGGTRNLARDGVGYDASNRFTAPCSGWYHFSAQINFSSCNDTDGTIKFLLNGSTATYGPSSSALGGSQYPGSRQVSGTMYLTEGDYIQVNIYVSGATNVVRGAQAYSGSFSGHFVG